jgi:hypothetical protein
MICIRADSVCMKYFPLVRNPMMLKIDTYLNQFRLSLRVYAEYDCEVQSYVIPCTPLYYNTCVLRINFITNLVGVQ